MVGVLSRFGGMRPRQCCRPQPTEFLADVGFKLRECKVRLRRKIFSVAESRRRVVVTARPEDPGATLEPEKKSVRRKNVVRAAALTRDGGVMVAQ
jgi:hypothetical protein